jgi:hypothetical protein
LPLEVYDGYLLVVEGSVGDRRGLKFLLDTGTTYTTIDRKLADALNLARRPGKVINLDKTLCLDRAVLPSIAFGPEHARNVDVLVADLRYFRASAIHIDAILGLDLLAQESFRVDFVRKLVVFGLPGHATYGVPLRVDSVSLRVPVELEGHEVWMIADTGAPGIVIYEDRLAALNADYRVEGHTTGRSLGGAVDSRIALLPRLRLATQDLDRRVYLTASPHSESLRDTTGYLGLACLHAKEIVFDFERNELRWTK